MQLEFGEDVNGPGEDPATVVAADTPAASAATVGTQAAAMDAASVPSVYSKRTTKAKRKRTVLETVSEEAPNSADDEDEVGNSSSQFQAAAPVGAWKSQRIRTAVIQR